MTYKEQLAEQDAMIKRWRIECDQRIEEFFAQVNKAWRRALTAQEIDDDQYSREQGDGPIF